MEGEGRYRLGAVPFGDGETAFAVWAPAAASVHVHAGGDDHPLERGADGIWGATLPVGRGSDYRFVLDDGRELADPCSRCQPGGTRGPSRVIDLGPPPPGPALPLDELVLYELHVGTFTPEGTFDGVIAHLPELRELGVTAIELMPVATFPGRRGWGYDGIFTSAPHEAYGGPEGLQRLVAAAHDEGLGVVLDVVYNHLGPGGGDFAAFGPWFAQREPTPWGAALDFSETGVREWAIQNAELWVRDYGVDGLRLDAVFAIHDDSPEHVLAELARRVHAIRPGALVISEMNTLDPRPLEEWGHDAMWLDRLHHELHVALTGERYGYWAPFEGTMGGIALELTRPQGPQLVVCAQNHDQVGNQPFGRRLPAAALRVAQAAVLFSPLTPILFQGEEDATTTPFLFFSDHDDPLFADATRDGRRRGLRDAGFPGEAPDPQAEETFARSVLDRTSGDPDHRAFVQRLLRLRRELPRELDVEADDAARTLVLRRGAATLRLDFAALAVELDA